jgi:hypothetical protein
MPQQDSAGQLPSGASTRTTNPDLADQVRHGDAEDSHAGPAMGEKRSPADPWRLNPQRLPRSITLELPEPLLAELLALAERQGRCLNEIATDLIAAQLTEGPID